MSGNEFSLLIKGHVAKSCSANTHPAKLLVLSSLLKELFGVRLEELIPGVESKLGSKMWGLRGSADLIFSNVVFEIKVDLKVEHDDAKEKLMKYFQVLYEKEPERRHVGIATDVIEFVAYTPVIKDGQVVSLNKTGSINIAEASSAESVLWLDSFVFSKPKIRPSAMDLRWRFGPDSPTYCVSVDGLTVLWDEVKDEKDARLKLDLWAKNMEIVYGGRPEVSAFLDHTYLVTLVKLIVYLRLSGDNVVREDRLVRALTGEYFSSYGIANLIEEDFFAWMSHPKIHDRTLRIVSDITRELLRYDLSQIDEDFFKEIYQEIVKRTERHRIGEYYTPEWLVELTLKESTELWDSAHQGTPRIFDPGCGSGTFLCNSIHIVKERLLKERKDPRYILDFILDSVVGVDINPLAVVIARANYIVALGEMLQLGKRIIIPIYVADSVKIPRVTETLTKKGRMSVYEFVVEVANKEKPKPYVIQIPKNVATQKMILSQVIEGYKAAIGAYRVRKNKTDALEAFRRSHITQLSDDELEALNATLNTVLMLIDAEYDAIWVFMLSNIYAPLTLAESKFDMVVGNPPWIAMRYMENKNYQDFIKQQVLAFNLLDSKDVKLFANLEMATFFFCRTSDLYLHKGGIMAMVMPRSVLTGSLQHANFKQLNKPKMKLAKIFDLEEVTPLFNVPACVLIAAKGDVTQYPVLARKYQGQLSEKNVRLNQAIKQLSASDYMYQPPSIPKEYSWYYEAVRRGGDIYPRSFWFVDFEAHPVLGLIDSSKPLLKSASYAAKEAKDRWSGVEVKGNVEAEFVYATLLSRDLVPFGYVQMRPVVLPIEPSQLGYRIFDSDALRNRGFKQVAEWLDKVQKFWEERRTEKDEGRFPHVIDRLNYNGLLAIQNPKKRYVVLYNMGGTNVVSCVIDRHSLSSFQVLKASIKPRDFVADTSTYIYEKDNETEPHYLCGVLNSTVLNEAIKPLQPRGLFGERAIHRRPFMLPVPKFNENDSLHIELVKMSQRCHAKLESHKFTKKSAGGLREEARLIVKKEIQEIDERVSELLGL